MKVILAIFIALMSFVTLADDFCSNASSKADTERAIIPSDESGFKVTGKGRVYFYSAPNEQCAIRNLFIVPGDMVNASVDYGDYTYIMYFTKEGEDIEGWVKSNRLAPTGTGNGPSSKNQINQ